MTIKTGKLKQQQQQQQQQQQKQTFFAEKFWENILTYFQKFSAKIFRFWSKNSWFLQDFDLEKLKKLKKI